MNTVPVRVLVVDDEPAIREMVRFSLRNAGMSVTGAEDARSALELISHEKPDIILMDWMMPGLSGIEFTRRLRRDSLTKSIPVIMLTAKISEDEKVTGLEAGCDDYVIKPFSPRELVARIRAVLRRTSPADEMGCIPAGELLLNTSSKVVTIRDQPVRLGPTEYRLLEFFASNKGRAFSRSQIIDHVWGPSVYIEERTVDVHIRRLRKALEPCGYHTTVQTVRGHGYRFLAPG